MLAGLLWMTLEMVVALATRLMKEMSMPHDVRILELQVVLLGVEVEL